jgi:hypothetical protein
MEGVREGCDDAGRKPQRGRCATAVNVTGTQDTGNSGGEFGNVSAILSGQDPGNIIGTFCPAGDNVLIGTDRAGTNKNYAFWVNFN